MEKQVELPPIGRTLSSYSDHLHFSPDSKSHLSGEGGGENNNRRSSRMSIGRDTYGDTLASKFNVSGPQKIIWAHAVNSRNKLRRALHGPAHMLEVDVTFGSFRPKKNKNKEANDDLLTCGSQSALLSNFCTSPTSPESEKAYESNPPSAKCKRAEKRTRNVVLCHPPFTTSDLTLQQFLKAVCEHNDAVEAGLLEDPDSREENEYDADEDEDDTDDDPLMAAHKYGGKENEQGEGLLENNTCCTSSNRTIKGIKLDFKDEAVVPHAIFMLQQLRVCERVPAVWLNADVCFGPGIPWWKSPVGTLCGELFLEQCSRLPEAVVSLGWVCTEYSFLASYTSSMLQEMLAVVKKVPEVKNQHITFAVCATYVSRSLVGLQNLLRECAGKGLSTSLTVWTGYGSWGITKEDEEQIIMRAKELSLSTFIDVRTRPARRMWGRMCRDICTIL